MDCEMCRARPGNKPGLQMEEVGRAVYSYQAQETWRFSANLQVQFMRLSHSPEVMIAEV